MKNFESEFFRIWNKIISKSPLAFTRYADGEISLMQGKKIDLTSQANRIDRWNCLDDNLTLLGTDLENTLYYTDPNWIYAISCKCCDPLGQKWILSKLQQSEENITYSNLWINGNYPKFINAVSNLSESVFLICNERGKDGMYPFDVFDFYPIEDNCVITWKNKKNILINDMISIANTYSEKLFLISAGPLSEVLIHSLWKSNPTNRYIDVGSAIDEFIYLSKTRPFMTAGNNYYNHICQF